ncbi:hypothetical protein Q8A67_021237 [Cirrhinus molitorella]|uniref:Uncharacterized protein n=1 Tax=Cirrhinus molitorella TaxID=172907 RepID=A0AA88P9D7_9TELE|nr:hypothetical protein Q8A67_021237 [Cirrhinus molitorella]
MGGKVKAGQVWIPAKTLKTPADSSTSYRGLLGRVQSSSNKPAETIKIKEVASRPGEPGKGTDKVFRAIPLINSMALERKGNDNGKSHQCE